MKIVGDTHLAWSRHSRLRTDTYLGIVTTFPFRWERQTEPSSSTWTFIVPYKRDLKRASWNVLVCSSKTHQNNKKSSRSIFMLRHIFLCFYLLFFKPFCHVFLSRQIFLHQVAPTGADTHWLTFPPFYGNRSDFFIIIIYLVIKELPKLKPGTDGLDKCFLFPISGH